MKPKRKTKVMKKLIRIKITGSHSQNFYAGDDYEKDFFDAIKAAAETLQKQNLSSAEILLFENDEATYEQAIRKVEIMRHK
jgi:hypothetical protein